MTITKEQAILELKRRGKDVSMYETSTAKTGVSNLRNSSPSITKEQAIEELRRRGKDVSMYETPSSQEPGWGQKALDVAKGAIAGVGGAIPDTAAMLYNIPASLHNMNVNAAKFYSPEVLSMGGLGDYAQVPGAATVQEMPLIPSATEAIGNAIDSNPEDNEAWKEGGKFAGSLLGLGGAGKIAGKLGAKGLEKLGMALGETAPERLAAAVPVGAAIHEVGEEYGPIAGIGAGALTGTALNKGSRFLNKSAQGLKGTLTGKGESLGDMTIGRAISKMGVPDKELEEVSNKWGKKLPFNVRFQGRISNSLANNIFNGTIFSSKEWNKVVDDLPKDTLKDILDEINKIHPENLGRQKTSEMARDLLKEDSAELKKIQNKMYDHFKEALAPGEKIEVSPLIDSLKDLRESFDVYSPSEPMRFVMKRVNEIGAGIGVITPKKWGGFSDAEKESPALFKKVVDSLEALDKKNGVWADARKIANQVRSLNEDTQYGSVKGTKNSVSHLKTGINKSFDKSPNQEAIKRLRAANNFTKNEKAARMNETIAESLLKKKDPKLAYDYMGSVEDIKSLQKSLGTSSNAIKIMNSLKRAKLKDIIEDKLIGSDKEIQWGAFPKLFDRKNENQELLQELLGESYPKLKELSTIAAAISKSAKTFQNTSNTAKVAADMARMSAFTSSIPMAATGNVSGALYSILGGGVSSFTPYIFSRLLANPRYGDMALKYFEESVKGNAAGADKYRNRIRDLIYDYSKKAAPYEVREKLKEKE